MVQSLFIGWGGGGVTFNSAHFIIIVHSAFYNRDSIGADPEIGKKEGAIEICSATRRKYKNVLEKSMIF